MENAAGADRFKVDLTFTKKLSSTDDANYRTCKSKQRTNRTNS